MAVTLSHLVAGELPEAAAVNKLLAQKQRGRAAEDNLTAGASEAALLNATRQDSQPTTQRSR